MTDGFTDVTFVIFDNLYYFIILDDPLTLWSGTETLNECMYEFEQYMYGSPYIQYMEIPPDLDLEKADFCELFKQVQEEVTKNMKDNEWM